MKNFKMKKKNKVELTKTSKKKNELTEKTISYLTWSKNRVFCKYDGGNYVEFSTETAPGDFYGHGRITYVDECNASTSGKSQPSSNFTCFPGLILEIGILRL